MKKSALNNNAAKNLEKQIENGDFLENCFTCDSMEQSGVVRPTWNFDVSSPVPRTPVPRAPQPRWSKASKRK